MDALNRLAFLCFFIWFCVILGFIGYFLFGGDEETDFKSYETVTYTTHRK